MIVKQLSLYCRTSPYIIGMVLQYMGNGIANILFILTVILSGYHVTMEGVEDTIENQKKGKFQPNVIF